MDPLEYQSAADLLASLFEDELANPSDFDQEVVALVQKHLGGTDLRSRAGNTLANDLGLLAQKRSTEKSNEMGNHGYLDPGD